MEGVPVDLDVTSESHVARSDDFCWFVQVLVLVAL